MSINAMKAQAIFGKLAQRNDVTLAVFLVAIVIMMILPMPTALVDALVTFNMAVGIVLLMVAVYIDSPLSFSAFPAVLLLTTLFRLALSITTTRLILLQADAGAIITTFGNFVVGGNLVVGIVVFLIITLVQFIVITKGSERVAEVSARFSLDGMPGKQMSIDGDMRAGVIDAQEARIRRRTLEKESQLYGSMDGAMKFVKGDAIAGIFIILINIIGGISIGTLQQDMSVGDALSLYTILTVGDGLVAQIPALFIAITAGIIVTRVSSEDSGNLGEDIGKQVLAQPKALMIGASVLFLFALIPGFPTPIFLTFGLLLGGIGLTLLTLDRRVKDKHGSFIEAFSKAKKEAASSSEGAMDDYSMAAPLSINLSSSLQALMKNDSLNAEFSNVRNSLNMDLGVPFPGVHMRYKKEIPDGKYEICLHEVPMTKGEIRTSHLLVRKHSDQLDALGIPYEKVENFLPNALAVWVSGDYEQTLRSNGISFFDAHQILAYHLTVVLRQYAEEFVGIQETSQLIDKLKPSCANLVKEVQALLPLPVIGGVLQRLVSEDVSIRNLRSIFEALLKFGKDEKDPSTLTEHARAQLRRQISHKYSGDNKELSAVLLDVGVEEMIRKAVKKGPAGNYLALDPNLSRHFIESIKSALDDVADQVKNPILITSVDIRRYISTLVQPYIHDLPVLSYQELTPEVLVRPVGRINMSS